MQIDRISTHNECTRHDSAAAPNGGYIACQALRNARYSA